jgi:hypothetical protein
VISIETIVMALLYLIVGGIIFWLLYWALGRINPPEPFKKVAEIILVVGAVFVCIAVLLALAGHPIVRW